MIDPLHRSHRRTMTAEALLFDMDGTLVDSTLAVEEAWRDWCSGHGVDFPTLMAASHGRRSDDTIRQFLDRDSDIATAVEEFTEKELAAACGARAVKGASELLRALPSDSWTIVTSASRTLAEQRSHHAGLPIPATMVTASDVANGKPAPDGYLLAATRLGLPPAGVW